MQNFAGGGVLSGKLGLPFNSPFVNVSVGIKKDDYFDLVYNLDKYMEVSPRDFSKSEYKYFNCNGWEYRGNYPKLWYEDIAIHGFHYRTQEDFFRCFERRRMRYNPQNKFILKALYDQSDIEKFEQIKSDKKLGFFCGKTNKKNIISLAPKCWHDYNYAYAVFLNQLVESGEFFSYIDIFSLLDG